MGFNLTKKVQSYGVVIFQKVLETARGGFALDLTGLTSGAIIPGGSLISFDESTRIAKVVKGAIVQANATNTATDIRIKKGHQFKIGDYVAAVLGGKAYAITAIDTANADYDQISVGTTLGVALTAGDGLFQSTATGASAAATLPLKGLLYEDTEVSTNADVAVVLRGTVYARRIPTVPSDVRAKLPLIIFSESF